MKRAMDSVGSRKYQDLNNSKGMAEATVKGVEAIMNGRPSSHPPYRWKYDVFLSFRPTDTRQNFTDHLCSALIRKEIFTFRDDEELGNKDQIFPPLGKAIEESKIAIRIFSNTYASSHWCLAELVKIMEFKTDRARFFPIFYRVDQSEGSHRKRNYQEEKWQRWMSAKRQPSNICCPLLIPRYPTMFDQNSCWGSPAPRKSENGHLNNVEGMADKHRLLTNRDKEAVMNGQPSSTDLVSYNIEKVKAIVEKMQSDKPCGYLGILGHEKPKRADLNEVEGMANEHRLTIPVQQGQPAFVIDIREGFSVPSTVKDNNGEFSHGDHVAEHKQLSDRAELFQTSGECLKWEKDEQVHQTGESPDGNGNKKPDEKTSSMLSGKERNQAIVGRVSSWSSILTFLLYGMHSNFKHRLRMKHESLSIWLAWGGVLDFTAFLCSVFLMIHSGARFTFKQIIFLLISATLMNVLTSGTLVPLYVGAIPLAA